MPEILKLFTVMVDGVIDSFFIASDMFHHPEDLPRHIRGTLTPDTTVTIALVGELRELMTFVTEPVDPPIPSTKKPASKSEPH